MPAAAAGRLTLVAATLVFVTVRVAEALQVAPDLVSSHLDDLIVMPVVLVAVLAAHRLAGRPAAWTLPLTHSLPVLGAYGLFFEGLLPRLDPRATADIRDLAAYAAGWIIFQTLLNLPGDPCGDGPSSRS